MNPTKFPVIAGLLVSSSCIALLLVKWEHHDFVDSVTLGIFALAVAPWLVPFITSVKLPGGVEVAFQKRVEKLEQTTSDHDQQIADQEEKIKAQQEALQKL
ncbi:MAG TPA: hypothetical protein VLA83_09680, partial [Candidatus Binatia bacterium]|nr:hypothetical protein [Candidatus Binatia bacterium]